MHKWCNNGKVKLQFIVSIAFLNWKIIFPIDYISLFKTINATFIYRTPRNVIIHILQLYFSGLSRQQ